MNRKQAITKIMGQKEMYGKTAAGMESKTLNCMLCIVVYIVQVCCRSYG